MGEPSEKSLEKMRKFVAGFANKTGTTMHPNPTCTEVVIKGLASHVDEFGKPLCPCNFYSDKDAEVKLRRWICACDEMQMYKYCHCLLFVREDGLPITEYLPDDHEGKRTYGVVLDPTPTKGRALRHLAPGKGARQPENVAPKIHPDSPDPNPSGEHPTGSLVP